MTIVEVTRLPFRLRVSPPNSVSFRTLINRRRGMSESVLWLPR